MKGDNFYQDSTRQNIIDQRIQLNYHKSGRTKLVFQVNILH